MSPEDHETRARRMARELAELEYRIQHCDPQDFLRLTMQIKYRKDGLRAVLKLKD